MATRATASINLQFGLLNVTGKLYTVASKPTATGKTTSAPKLTSCCPTCHETKGLATKTNRVQVCPEGHGPFPESDLLKAVGPAKALVVVTDAETLKEKKKEAADEEGVGLVCRLGAFPADEVLDALIPVETPWAFVPDIPSNIYQMMVDHIEADGRAGTEAGDTIMLGMVQLRAGTPSKLVSLRTRNGRLLLQEMTRPENVNTEIRVVEPVKVEDIEAEQFKVFLSLARKEFSTKDFTNEVGAKVTSFIQESLSDGNVLPMQPITAAAPEAAAPNVSDLLAAMIAEAKAS